MCTIGTWWDSLHHLVRLAMYVGSNRVGLTRYVTEAITGIGKQVWKRRKQGTEARVVSFGHVQALDRELNTAKSALESRGDELKELRKEHFELKSDRTVTSRSVKASEQQLMRLRKQVRWLTNPVVW